MHLTQRKQYAGQATAEEIRGAVFGLQQDTIVEIDTTDSEHDGFYDIYETVGMMLSNEKCIYADPQTRDTDGDGLEVQEARWNQLDSAVVCNTLGGHYKINGG